MGERAGSHQIIDPGGEYSSSCQYHIFKNQWWNLHERDFGDIHTTEKTLNGKHQKIKVSERAIR